MGIIIALVSQGVRVLGDNVREECLTHWRYNSADRILISYAQSPLVYLALGKKQEKIWLKVKT